jgi:hypothetical protein
VSHHVLCFSFKGEFLQIDLSASPSLCYHLLEILEEEEEEEESEGIFSLFLFTENFCDSLLHRHQLFSQYALVCVLFSCLFIISLNTF